MDNVVLGWHFVRNDGRTGQGRIPVVVGEVLHVEPPITCCEHGLHYSERALDALKYAPGAWVSRVETWGERDRQSDKGAAEYRCVVWMADASTVLHTFACDVAEEALRTAGVTDERAWVAIEAKRAWLRGKISDGALAAAAAAAWDAASAAASAARAAAAAAAAAWDADAAAAASAARAAAASAARAAAAAAAAYDVAYDAAWQAMNDRLEAALLTLAQ